MITFKYNKEIAFLTMILLNRMFTIPLRSRISKISNKLLPL